MKCSGALWERIGVTFRQKRCHDTRLTFWKRSMAWIMKTNQNGLTWWQWPPTKRFWKTNETRPHDRPTSPNQSKSMSPQDPWKFYSPKKQIAESLVIPSWRGIRHFTMHPTKGIQVLYLQNNWSFFIFHDAALIYLFFLNLTFFSHRRESWLRYSQTLLTRLILARKEEKTHWVCCPQRCAVVAMECSSGSQSGHPRSWATLKELIIFITIVRIQL